MKILVMGLPGSGKTYLTERLVPLIKAAWYNADKVREMANDWDFSDEGRDRQSKRMRAFADFEKSHGRSTSDTVRFRGAPSTSASFNNPTSFDGVTGSNIAKSAGYSITVGKRDSSGNIANTENFYHFTVDTNTATTGGISGGGNSCSAGPATLTA